MKSSKIKVIIFFLLLNFPLIVFALDTSQTGGAVELINPIGTHDPNEIIGMVISAILGVVGSLALLMFVYGGFTWMLAAGNSERVTKGKEIIIWASIGLVVIFSAYAFVKFILQGLGVPTE